MKNLANKITVARMVIIPLFLITAYSGHKIISFLIFFVACISDFADGYIARRFNQISNFGKLMDPLADKVLVLSAMCFFIEKGIMPGWAVAIIIFREFSVSGLRMIASSQNIVLAATLTGKIKTLCTMVGICILLVFHNYGWVKNTVTLIIVFTTLASGIEFFINNYSILKNK